MFLRHADMATIVTLLEINVVLMHLNVLTSDKNMIVLA